MHVLILLSYDHLTILKCSKGNEIYINYVYYDYDKMTDPSEKLSNF